MKETTFRGYKIKKKDNQFVFSDTGESTENTWESRPCGYCDKYNSKEGHDGCLGILPNVMNACCGHGDANEAYVQFWNGSIERGREATDVIKTLIKNEKETMI